MVPIGNQFISVLFLIAGFLDIGVKSYPQNPIVEVEIQYYAPDAGEVFLVWGVDGWLVPSELTLPEGTEIKNKVLFTPMEKNDRSFIATIQIPPESKLDFGFLVTRLAAGRPVSIWDEARSVTNRNIIAGKEIIEVRGDLGEVAQKWRLKVSDILLPILSGIGIVAILFTALHIGDLKNFKQTSLILIISILIIGLTIRLVGSVDWNSYHPDSPERLIGDEPGYDNLAREVIRGLGFTWPGRVPVYPLWLAGIYILNGGSYQSVPYIQAFLGVLTILLTFLMGKHF
jgi:hypothetical protein